MKYSNREEAASLCNQISKLDQLRNDLICDNPFIKIHNVQCHIISIGADISSDHPYAKQAQAFIAAVIKQIDQKLDILHHDLSKL